MTFVGWLVIILVAAGASLIAAQLLVKGYLLAAAATWVLGAGVTLTAYKAHRSAVGAARLLSEHRREAARGRALLAELAQSVQKSQAQRHGQSRFLPLEPHTGTSSLQADVGEQPAPVLAESPGRSVPVQTESRGQSTPVQAQSPTLPPNDKPESHDHVQVGPASRFRPAIGAIEPSLVSGLDQGVKGRQAAAVTRDEALPSKLFSATLGMGSSVLKPGHHDLRPIAGIVSTELLGVLESRYAFTQFRPGLLPVELECSQPSALVFEESACDIGAWFGALGTTGAALFTDIQAALTWAKAKSQSIFVLPDSTPKPYSAVLRRRATYVVQSDSAPVELTGGVSLPLLAYLVDYVSGAEIGPSQSASEVHLAS